MKKKKALALLQDAAVPTARQQREMRRRQTRRAAVHPEAVHPQPVKRLRMTASIMLMRTAISTKNLTMSLSTCLSAGTAALKRRRISTTTT